MTTAEVDHATLVSFAQALLDLSDARGQTAQVAEEIAGVAEVVRDNPTFVTYLGDPTVSNTSRAEKLERIFAGQISPLVDSFIKLLNDRGRLTALPQIARVYRELLDEREGNVDVEIAVAIPLDDQQLEDVRQKISTSLKKNARITQRVDEDLIGGLVIKVGDSLIDGSVKTQLESIKGRMIAAA